MSKFLSILVFSMVAVGVANMGNAGSLFYGDDGGEGGKGGRGGPSGPPSPEVFKPDFQFIVQPWTQNPDSYSSVTNPFEDYLNSRVGWNHDHAGASFNFDFDFSQRGNGESNYVAQNNIPVSEPTTMLLLGIGLIVMSGFGGRKFKKVSESKPNERAGFDRLPIGATPSPIGAYNITLSQRASGKAGGLKL